MIGGRWGTSALVVALAIGGATAACDSGSTTAEDAATKPTPRDAQPKQSGTPSSADLEANADAGAGKATVAKMFEVCKAKDGAALHGMFGAQMREQVDAQASRMAEALSAEVLAKDYGYEGKVDEVDGPTLLTMGLGADDEHKNLCWRASEWRLLVDTSEGDFYGAFYELPSGLGRSVTAEKTATGWTIAKVSKSMRPDQWPDEARAKIVEIPPPAEAAPAAK